MNFKTVVRWYLGWTALVALIMAFPMLHWYNKILVAGSWVVCTMMIAFLLRHLLVLVWLGHRRLTGNDLATISALGKAQLHAEEPRLLLQVIERARLRNLVVPDWQAIVVNAYKQLPREDLTTQIANLVLDAMDGNPKLITEVFKESERAQILLPLLTERRIRGAAAELYAYTIFRDASAIPALWFQAPEMLLGAIKQMMSGFRVGAHVTPFTELETAAKSVRGCGASLPMDELLTEYLKIASAGASRGHVRELQRFLTELDPEIAALLTQMEAQAQV